MQLSLELQKKSNKTQRRYCFIGSISHSIHIRTLSSLGQLSTLLNWVMLVYVLFEPCNMKSTHDFCPDKPQIYQRTI